MPTIDHRRQTGVRAPAQGQWNKPGVFFPTPGNYSDYGLIEVADVDSKEQALPYLTPHPSNAALLLTKQTFSEPQNAQKTRTRIYRTLPGALQTRTVYDEILNADVTVETQDLAIGTPMSRTGIVLSSQDSDPTEQGWITRTTMRLAALPKTQSKVVTQQFTFPAILTAATIDVKNFGVEMEADGVTIARSNINTAYVITPTIRPAISAPTKHYITTEYFLEEAFSNATSASSVLTFTGFVPATSKAVQFTSLTGGSNLSVGRPYYLIGVSGQTAQLSLNPGGTAITLASPITASTGIVIPADDPLYEISTNNPRYSGRLVDFNFGEVLNNAFDVNASAGANDYTLSGLTESYSIGNSTPTATAYQADIGSRKIISSDVERYRGSLWVKTNTAINIR